MAGLKYALPKDFEILSADSEVKDPSYRILIGNAANKELNKVPTEVNYSQDSNAKSMFSYPEVGRMPEKRLEAATSTLVLDALGIPHEIGQKIHLKLYLEGKERTETFTLCGYWEGDPVNLAQQFWLSRVYCDEIVPAPDKAYQDTDRSHTAGYWMIDFNFSNSWDIEGKMQALLARNGYDVEHTDYGINWAYATSDIDSQSILIYALLLAVVLLSGYLLIYNIFYINVIRDLQYYGLLKTIGTTKRQLKRLVRLQGCILSLWGIPAGLILGTLLSRVLFPIIISNFQFGTMVFFMHPAIYVLAAIFSFITVLASCMKPCRMAAKVSPMEAFSYTEHLPVKKKKAKNRKTTVFSMAWRNLGQSRKKATVAIISICLSLLLVNTTFTVTKGFDLDKYVGEQIIGDLLIGGTSTFNTGAQELILDPIKKADREFLSCIDGVTQESDVYCSFGDVSLKGKPYDRVMNFIADTPEIFNNDEPWMEDAIQYTKDEKSLECTIYGMDDYSTDHLIVQQGKIDWKAFQSGDYVLVEKMYGNNAGNVATTEYCDVGQRIPLELPDGSKKEYEVMAIVEIPTALTNRMSSTLGTCAVLPSKEYLSHAETNGALLSILTLSPEKKDTAEQLVKSYTENENPDLVYRSKQDYEEEFQGFIQMFHIVGAVLSGILGLIGILNFVSTMVSGILARKQELAMMQAVGMTGKQMKGMLVWEGLLYAIIALVVTLTLGSVGCWAMIQAIAGEIWFFTYHFSIVPVLLCAVPLVLITWLVPTLAYCSLRKKTIVEQLRLSA